MQIAEIIREVSMDLNDQEPGHEYVRWSVVQLHSYLREALVTVSRQLSDLFTKQVVVRAVGGNLWHKACDCTRVTRIFGESTKRGTVVRVLRRYADYDEFTWAGPVEGVCPKAGYGYQPYGYSLSATDESAFRILPSVPRGEVRYFLVECYKMPTGSSLDHDVPEEIVAMLKQWMLYRALVMDSENNPAITALGKQHKETFFEMLKLALEMRAQGDKDNDRVRTVQKSTNS